MIIQWKWEINLRTRSDRQSAWWTIDGGSWHCTGDSDKDHPQEKEMQNDKMVVLGGLTNSWDNESNIQQSCTSVLVVLRVGRGGAGYRLVDVVWLALESAPLQFHLNRSSKQDAKASDFCQVMWLHLRTNIKDIYINTENSQHPTRRDHNVWHPVKDYQTRNESGNVSHFEEKITKSHT